MRLCIYLCAYVCVIFVCMCACMFATVCLFNGLFQVSVCTDVCGCLHLCDCAFISVCMHVCVCVFATVRVCVYIGKSCVLKFLLLHTKPLGLARTVHIHRI
jgi:hypothetical protein